jgi:hypothetical protein
MLEERREETLEEMLEETPEETPAHRLGCHASRYLPKG